MPDAAIGQQVLVDISGLEASSIKFGSGRGTVTKARGVITDIDAAQRLVTVQLDIALNGQRTVVASAQRVEVIP